MSFVLVRASNPRYRFDALIKIIWKDFLPVLLGFFFFIVGFLKSFGGFYVPSTPYQNLTDVLSLVDYSFFGFGLI